MPFKPQGKFHKCKYCDLPAKVNYFGIKRKHKGYYRTCGSKKCLTEQFRDVVVNRKKSYKAKGIIRPCGHCKVDFLKEQHLQRWCKNCCNSKSATAMLRRYNISYPEYSELLKIDVCPICLKNKPSVIDHCHTTGKVRGFICQGCNSSLFLIENKDYMERALSYLQKNAIQIFESKSVHVQTLADNCGTLVARVS